MGRPLFNWKSPPLLTSLSSRCEREESTLCLQKGTNNLLILKGIVGIRLIIEVFILLCRLMNGIFIAGEGTKPYVLRSVHCAPWQ